ncbi:maleate cis-trans isomerase [Rhodovarius crocodyli]|uniref:Maleate cis-trans isomerase n=1 Tax=Rhodovarius crocodyli TaxID=1979269 RepID=A0A437MGD3_9PROT|nr:aspartate/glutamate racemase family protein [Rhodovarius crocodyli]RVT96713.1 maleate cis-trans isomerase [Rhodovarius crocodyli]
MDNKVRRIGVLAPPGNTAMERELPLYVPPGILVNHNRLSRPDSSISAESLRAMAQSLDQAAHDIAQAYPEVIIYGCTSASFLEGLGQEARLADRITAQTGIAAVTTSTAVVEALNAFNARRVFMITPYPDAVNEKEVVFLEHYGFSVGAMDTFRRDTSEKIRELSSDDVFEMVLANKTAIAGCDTIFLSCTNLLTMDRIADIETALDRPVVSSNQASLWAALQRMKVPPRANGAGRLFETSLAVPA